MVGRNAFHPQWNELVGFMASSMGNFTQAAQGNPSFEQAAMQLAPQPCASSGSFAESQQCFVPVPMGETQAGWQVMSHNNGWAATIMPMAMGNSQVVVMTANYLPMAPPAAQCFQFGMEPSQSIGSNSDACSVGAATLSNSDAISDLDSTLSQETMPLSLCEALQAEFDDYYQSDHSGSMEPAMPLSLTQALGAEPEGFALDLREVPAAAAPQRQKAYYANRRHAKLSKGSSLALGQVSAQTAYGPAEASEEDWQRRHAKRQAVLLSIKRRPEYQHACDLWASSEELTALLRGPNPFDRSISKRSWESAMRNWQQDLRVAFAEHGLCWRGGGELEEDRC
eukprot:TRINITY_DN90250_c0_g1_i1.p1 TRINITY_DN90250_c0_g1~~TRINITY_DN90250_c0_g1_i1.p1  ORF type:complete len:339 (-),score=83.21 TRINITY_DN90250_c0_g1_i1:160-1176(-)